MGKAARVVDYTPTQDGHAIVVMFDGDRARHMVTAPKRFDLGVTVWVVWRGGRYELE